MNAEQELELRDRMKQGHLTADMIREQLVDYCKNFKTSWVQLGQALYPVWKDKLFYAWGYEKFEYYTKEELGLKQSTAVKLLKTYFFLEQNEPAYLQDGFQEQRKASEVPGCDEVNVLRLARSKKELNKEDYRQLRDAVFKEGKDAGGVRKDLTALMKERKVVDPDEERQERNDAAIRKLVGAIKNFSKDMEVLKLAPPQLLEEARDLLKKLEEEII